MVNQDTKTGKVTLISDTVDGGDVLTMERSGSKFVFTYLGADGSGQVTILNTVTELEDHMTLLYSEYYLYLEKEGKDLIDMDIEEDLKQLKIFLNV